MNTINLANIVGKVSTIQRTGLQNTLTINTETPYENWQIAIITQVLTLINVVITGDDTYQVPAGIYIVAIRKVGSDLQSAIYEFSPLRDINEEGGPGEPRTFESCRDFCVSCAYLRGTDNDFGDVVFAGLLIGASAGSILFAGGAASVIAAACASECVNNPERYEGTLCPNQRNR